MSYPCVQGMHEVGWDENSYDSRHLSKVDDTPNTDLSNSEKKDGLTDHLFKSRKNYRNNQGIDDTNKSYNSEAWSVGDNQMNPQV